MQLYILSDKRNRHAFLQRLGGFNHVFPAGKMRLGSVKLQPFADNAGKVLFLQHQWAFIKHIECAVLNDAFRLHVTEHSNFTENRRVFNRLIGSKYDNIRMDTHTLQFFDGMLGRFGFMLIAAMQKRNKRHMDVHGIFFTDFQPDLPDCLDKGLPFDVADGAADFCDHNVRFRFSADVVYKGFDLIRNMRDNLYRAAEVFSSALFVQNIPVDFAGRQIGILIQIFINKTLIMPEIQIRFRTVFRDIYLSVLIGAHSARVNIDIRIELLGCNLQPPGFQKPAKGSGCNPLPKAGHDTARNKDVFCHGRAPILFNLFYTPLFP